MKNYDNDAEGQRLQRTARRNEQYKKVITIGIVTCNQLDAGYFNSFFLLSIFSSQRITWFFPPLLLFAEPFFSSFLSRSETWDTCQKFSQYPSSGVFSSVVRLLLHCVCCEASWMCPEGLRRCCCCWWLCCIREVHNKGPRRVLMLMLVPGQTASYRCVFAVNPNIRGDWWCAREKEGGGSGKIKYNNNKAAAGGRERASGNFQPMRWKTAKKTPSRGRRRRLSRV